MRYALATSLFAGLMLPIQAAAQTLAEIGPSDPLAWLHIPLLTDIAGTRAGGVGLLGLVLATAYYLTAWLAVGNKRLHGKVSSRPTPPTDIPPAALRHVYRMGYDDKTFAVALLSMAVKGYLYIEEKERTLSIVRDESEPSVLTADEAKVARRIFESRNKLTLSWSNRALLADLKKYVRYQLDQRYRTGYFRRNSAWCVTGLLLSTAAMLAMFFTHFVEVPGTEAVRRLLDFGIGLGLAVLAPVLVFRELRRATPSALVGRLPVTLGLIAVICCLLGAAMVYDAAFALYEAQFLVGLFVLAGLMTINALLLPRLPAYTRQGLAIMREAAGFKRYLRERGGPFFPNEDATRIFEVFLPYAVALDEGEAWGVLLMDALGSEPEAERETPGYSPVWYSGQKWARQSPPDFVVSITGALTASLSSTAAPASPEAGTYKTVKRPGASSQDPTAKNRDRMH